MQNHRIKVIGSGLSTTHKQRKWPLNLVDEANFLLDRVLTMQMFMLISSNLNEMDLARDWGDLIREDISRLEEIESILNTLK